ncbi:MAG: GLPGLI family protein [Ferruginibacter sp.]
MKIKIYFIIALILPVHQLQAQLFINKAVIEYEVKVNVKKTMGNNSWEEMMKENLPQFKTGYFQYTFADNKSVYKFDHWDTKKVPEWMRRSDEENVWYFDHNTGKFNMQKNVWGSNFNVEDSIPAIEWRLTNENRVIAGFNCRKAVGKIMDSVYVFAFYTDEITISGGPCTINGLPGMILGLTIPRMYASWIATKVMVNDVNVAVIKPVTAKKYYTYTTLKSTLKERSKEWISEDDPDSNKWIEQLFWNTLL